MSSMSWHQIIALGTCPLMSPHVWASLGGVSAPSSHGETVPVDDAVSGGFAVPRELQ